MNIVKGIGAAAALSAARIYLAGIPGYSLYCLAGGAAAAYSDSIAAMLPSSLQAILDRVPLGGASAGVIAAAGAAAYEMAFDGSLLNEPLEYGTLMRLGIGAGAALVGAWGAQMGAGMIGY